MITKPIGPPAIPDYPAEWRPILVAAVERSKRTAPAFNDPGGLAMLLRVECYRDRSFYNRMAPSDITDMLGIAFTMLAADEWFARQQCLYCGDPPIPGLLTCMGCFYAHPTF
jgi:hypothetical protein